MSKEKEYKDRSLVVADNNQTTHSLATRDKSDVIDLALVDGADGTQWQSLVASRDTAKIVHKPNKSQKAFEVTITDQSGGTKELLVFVKRHSKDPFTKGQSETDDFEGSYVTFVGDGSQKAMAERIGKLINANLTSTRGKGEHLTQETPKTERHPREIDRYSSAAPYTDTREAVNKALKSFVANLNSTGMLHAELKDDRVIHEERKSQIDPERLESLVRASIIGNQDALNAINNLMLASQLHIRMSQHDALDEAFGMSDPISTAVRERNEVIGHVHKIIRDELPEKIHSAIMEEVDRVRPVKGMRSISDERIQEIVFKAISESFDINQYQGNQKNHVGSILSNLSYAMSEYINDGIDNGRAFPAPAVNHRV